MHCITAHHNATHFIRPSQFVSYRLIQLVGEEDQEDKKRDNEEAVTQGRVGRGPPLVGVDVGHPQQDAGEDDGVEDAHQRDAEHDPEGDEGDLP